jgi:hypothetical protein
MKSFFSAVKTVWTVIFIDVIGFAFQSEFGIGNSVSVTAN